MSDTFMMKSQSGRKMHIRIAGKNTLSVCDKYAPNTWWEVRLPDRRVNKRGNIMLCPDADIGKGDITYLVPASDLARQIHDSFFGMLSLMSEEFRTFVNSFKPAEADQLEAA